MKNIESKLWVIPEAGAFRLYASLGAAREHVATFKREVDANKAVERINGWQDLVAQRNALLEACKSLLENRENAEKYIQELTGRNEPIVYSPEMERAANAIALCNGCIDPQYETGGVR